MRLLHVVVVLAMLAPSVARIACGLDCMRVQAQAAAPCHEDATGESSGVSVKAFDASDCHPQEPVPPSTVSSSMDASALMPAIAQPFLATIGAPRASAVSAWTLRPPGIQAPVPLRI